MDRDEALRVLGLDSSASEEAIKAAYKKHAFEAHPDRGGDTEKLKDVNLAYDVLTHPEKYTPKPVVRQRPGASVVYDRARAASAASHVRRAASRIPHDEDVGGSRCGTCGGTGVDASGMGFMGRCGECGGRGWNP